jgi:CubicO group peptidase (beta-lactamase class C family)
MDSLCRKLFAVVLSSLICVCTFALADMPAVAPEEVGLSSERLERLTRLMENGVEKGHFPGATAAIARHGKIAYFETYGYQDEGHETPMAGDAIFRIASMTKAITGVAVMMLYEEGHFSLHDPVSRFIPAYANVRVSAEPQGAGGKKGSDKDAKRKSSEKSKEDASAKKKEDWTEEDIEEWLAKNGKDVAPKTVPAVRPITIRDLLRHTSGISYPGKNIFEEGMTFEALIDRLAEVPLVAQPGTKWQYGMSQDVLARVVEVISGISFDDFIQERIFDPLGMTDTAFYVPEKNHARLVKMESAGSKGGKKSAVDTYLKPPSVLGGGSGLVSTTMGYLRFCQMLLNDGELEGKRLLGRKAVELMRTDHMADIPPSYAATKLGTRMRFGLTFGIKGPHGETGMLGSEGSYYWGGA